jgi:GMP synthase (glutamine-hydrolysing)
MKRVLFIQHGEQDVPGLFASAMETAGIELERVESWRGEPLPDIAAFDGVAIGGGGMSAYETDEYPFLAAEMALIRAARGARKPLLGICLGAQLMAAALGAKVFLNRVREIGFHEVRFTEAAAADPVWAECAPAFKPVHWHGDTFTLPRGAELLASSDLTAHQLFRIDGLHYGIQFHLEIDLPVLTAMVGSDTGDLKAAGIDPDVLLRDAREHLPRIEPAARAVFARWAHLLHNQTQVSPTPATTS